MKKELEEKKLTKFTFYEMYYETLKKGSDEYAGRLIKSICKFVFEGVQPEFATDDILLSFDIDHMFKTLRIATEIELRDRTPKTLNKKMRHFTFYITYYEAIKLLDERQGGQYVKAICAYMIEKKDPKCLSPLAEKYYKYAMWDLEISKLRMNVGRKGGKTKKIVTSEITLEMIKDEFGLTGEIFHREEYLKGIDLNKAYEYFKDNRPPVGKSIYHAFEEYKKAQTG